MLLYYSSQFYFNVKSLQNTPLGRSVLPDNEADNQQQEPPVGQLPEGLAAVLHHSRLLHLFRPAEAVPVQVSGDDGV